MTDLSSDNPEVATDLPGQSESPDHTPGSGDHEKTDDGADADADEDQTFTFTVDLAVVESLGINLYSNAAAVLSELVANAWDADANRVTVTWPTSSATTTNTETGNAENQSDSSDERHGSAPPARIQTIQPERTDPSAGTEALPVDEPQPSASGASTPERKQEQPPPPPPPSETAPVAARTTVVIEDDGNGMDLQDLNERFLTVAYKKREEEGRTSPRYHRPFMGRKGIGKLAVFSLASQIEVYSAKNGHRHGFRIRVDDLRRKIDEKKAYHPVPIPVPEDMPARGTRIVLSELNRKRTAVSVTALRRRLARRFDVLNFAPTDEERFVIVVGNEPITYADREDLRRVEFLWELGGTEIAETQTPNSKQRWVVSDNTVDQRRDWKVEGWFGTVAKPGDLNDAEDKQESLRNIIILARKRPIQEGILDQLDFNQIFGNYVTGQIRAEFLDMDGRYDDIATSDRQRLIEDDERVKLLVAKLRELFTAAADQWIEARPRHKFHELTAEYPVVRDWVNGRDPEQRPAARKIIETVAALELNNEDDRPQLYKSSILAFEKIALDATTKELGDFAENLTAVQVLPLLATARSYEDALYVQLLRSRLAEIEVFESMLDKDEKERVLQQHLFENMWLLDPAWEGAAGDADMEISLRRIRRGVLFDKSEEANQKAGRIDIQYRSSAGTHMIVELKKYRRECTIDELVEQGSKYYEALDEVLTKKGMPRDIRVVFVLGEKPKLPFTGRQSDDDYIDDRLKHINGTILYYERMLDTAQRRYKDYRDRRKEVTELDNVLRALDD